MKEKVKIINFLENSSNYLYYPEKKVYKLRKVNEKKSINPVRFRQAETDFKYFLDGVRLQKFPLMEKDCKMFDLINIMFKILEEQYKDDDRLEYYKATIKKRGEMLKRHFSNKNIWVASIEEKNIIHCLSYIYDLGYCSTTLGIYLNLIVRSIQLYNNFYEDNKNMIFENKKSSDFLDVLFKEKEVLYIKSSMKNEKSEIKESKKLQNNVDIKLKKCGKIFGNLSKGEFFVFVGNTACLYLKTKETRTNDGKTINACNINTGSLLCVSSDCPVIEMKIDLKAEEV